MAVGLFDGAKRSFVGPADARVEIPIIDKRVAQVIAITGESLQLMDMETYEVFEVPLPQEEDIRKRLEPSIEVEYWRSMGKSKVVRVRGTTTKA